MVITVKFVGAFRGASGKSKITLTFGQTVSLEETVNRIVQKMPKLQKVLIDPELGKPRPNSLILVNGKEISALNGLETLLRDNDEVVFVPVIHGG